MDDRAIEILIGFWENDLAFNINFYDSKKLGSIIATIKALRELLKITTQEI